MAGDIFRGPALGYPGGSSMRDSYLEVKITLHILNRHLLTTPSPSAHIRLFKIVQVQGQLILQVI